MPLSQVSPPALRIAVRSRPGDLELDQPWAQGRISGSARRAPLPRLAAGVERIGGTAGAEHHVEGECQQQDVGPAGVSRLRWWIESIPR